jgi:hypothetical protein
VLKHDKVSSKKPDATEQKSHISQDNYKTSVEQFFSGGQHSAPAGDTPFQPPIMAHLEMLSEATSVEERAKVMSHLQQSYGNRYVLRLLNSKILQSKLPISDPNNVYEQEADRFSDIVQHSKTSAIQKVDGDDPYEESEVEDIYAEMEPSTEVPDLTKGTVDQVRSAIVNTRLQDAIDLILTEVQDSKMPNLSQCQPPTIEYDAAFPYAGCTNCAYHPEDNTVESIRVTVGKKAFATVSYLYSTMMHEYQHVNGYLTDPKSTRANSGMTEFIAYSWEIYHAQETGLINQPDKLTYRGRLMKTMGFDKMSALEQDENIEVYEHAITIIQDAIGDPSWQP